MSSSIGVIWYEEIVMELTFVGLRYIRGLSCGYDTLKPLLWKIVGKKYGE